MSRSLLQDAILCLLRENDDLNFGAEKRFYAHFISSMRKHFDVKGIDTAAVNVTDHINLYINSDFFQSLNMLQRVQLLEHEVLHLIRGHTSPKRFSDIGGTKDDIKLWQIAQDLEINDPLTSLHELGVTVEKFKTIIPDLEHGEIAEYYFFKLKQYRDENGGKGGQGDQNIDEIGDTVDDHNAWGKDDKLQDNDQNSEEMQNGQIEEINRQVIKDAMNKAISKCRGNVPVEILKALDDLNIATVNWRQQLKQFLAKADKFNKEPTRKKLNRRYRHLNPGKRKKPITHIAIAIDESGSVSDALHKQFFSEIDNAARLDGIKFTLIHADCQINRVYEYKPGMNVERTGYGGTKYMPAINKAVELKVDGMIYFGDGDIFGEQLTKPRFPFLWAMEEGRNAPADWGKVCHVKYDRTKGY